MNLYLDDPKKTEKTAGLVARLSDESDNWPQELSSELYKQLPYLSDYEVHIDLERVDPQRGFGHGFADISNVTERPEVEHGEAGLPHIRIPIIIQDRALKTLATFMDGESVMPLNEDRIREALFQPATFDLSNSEPRDPSLVNDLMPPQRSGMGAGEVKTAGTKTAGARPSLLMAIAGTVHQADVDAFTDKVASDQSIIHGFKRSGIAPLLVKFASVKRASAKDHLIALAENIPPNVVTLQKLPGREFLVKSAATNAFAGGPAAEGQIVPQAEAAGAIGDENAQSMMPGQSLTVNADPIQQPMDPKPPKVKPIDEFGQYKVQDLMGNTLIGHVFPTSLAWDGNFSEQPIAVFTNGSAYAVQDTISGELVGKGTNLSEDPPRGEGVFYSVEGGEAVCTGPITVGSSAAGPDGLAKLQCTDLMGNPVQVSFMDELKTPHRITDTEYSLPSSWKFMRLNNQTQLVQSPEEQGKTAAVRSMSGKATLFYNGAYQLDGGCGLDKIASNLRYDMDPVHAEFMLGVLGLDGQVAKLKVAEARRKGEVKLAGLKTITTLGELHASSVKTASVFLSKIPNLRRDLVKEASGLEDTGTVDNVLALNFLNSENLPTFVGYIPELEQTSERLAEMMLSAQLGQNELPENEIEQSMKNLEEVIQGLKAVAHAGV